MDIEQWYEEQQEYQQCYNRDIDYFVKVLKDPSKHFKSHDEWQKYYADTLYDTIGSELFRSSMFSEVLEEYLEEDESLELQ